MTFESVASAGRRRVGRNGRLLDLAEMLVSAEARHRPAQAARHAGMAGRFASQRHPGSFVSLSLERSLGEVARHLPPPPANGADPFPGPVGPAGSGKLRVLHVTTRVVALGGHTRWVRRIIESDVSRSHSLAVTGATSPPVPPDLAGAITASGGSIFELGRAGASALQVASELRQLAKGFDVLILSTDPGDTVDSLAFATNEPRPPIARLNHSDHIFWLGAAITDLLVEFRPCGARLSERRRGFPNQRIAILPLPVDPPPPADREEARVRLGMGDAFVLLSIGAPYKFEPFGGLGFLDAVEPVLAQLPYLSVVVVGPSPQGRWSEAVARSGGRLVVRPPTADLAPYFAAADAFLNPLPVGSDTVLWEAAAAGLPLITVKPELPGLELVRGDPSECEGVALVPAPDGLREAVEELHDDPPSADRLGEAARQLVTAERMGQGWAAQLDAVLARALEATPMSAGELAPSGGIEAVDSYISSWASLGSLPEAALRRVLRSVAPEGRRTNRPERL